MANLNEKVFIFIDEFGNTSLNTSIEGTSSHFVYAALVLQESQIEMARKVRNEINDLYFKGSTIKSNRVPNDEKGFNKRLNILIKLKELDFKVFALVIDKAKAEVTTGGIEYKETFIKFFNKVFLKPLAKSFASYEVYADKTGWPEFQRSLHTYIEKNVLQRDLFNPDRTFRLVDDMHEEPLVQLADILAGSLGKIYCTSNSFDSVKSSLLFDLLHDRLFVNFYPSGKVNYIGDVKGDQSTDGAVQKIAVESAVEVLENRARLTDEAVVVLEYLLLMFKTSPSRMVESYEIVEKAKTFSPAFTSNNLKRCIQNLRDNGALIASIQGKSGYKLPDRVEDVVGFYNRNLNNIVLMINRIILCDSRLKQNGVNPIDILNMDKHFVTLKELIKAVQKSS